MALSRRCRRALNSRALERPLHSFLWRISSSCGMRPLARSPDVKSSPLGTCPLVEFKKIIYVPKMPIVLLNLCCLYRSWCSQTRESIIKLRNNHAQGRQFSCVFFLGSTRSRYSSHYSNFYFHHRHNNEQLVFLTLLDPSATRETRIGISTYFFILYFFTIAFSKNVLLQREKRLARTRSSKHSRFQEFLYLTPRDVLLFRSSARWSSSSIEREFWWILMRVRSSTFFLRPYAASSEGDWKPPCIVYPLSRVGLLGLGCSIRDWG